MSNGGNPAEGGGQNGGNGPNGGQNAGGANGGGGQNGGGGAGQGGPGNPPQTGVLKRCIGEEHPEATSRLSSCLTGAIGVALVLGGALALLTQTPKILPTRLPTIIAMDVGFFTALGVFATGLTVLGRRRLVRRLLGVGGRIRSGLLGN